MEGGPPSCPQTDFGGAVLNYSSMRILRLAGDRLKNGRQYVLGMDLLCSQVAK